eukprot:gene5712-11530_t
MYVWRSKNRRDRRGFLTSGSALWGAPDGSKETSKEDERYRQEHEKEFVGNYKRHMKTLIFEYLSTKHGQIEIQCVGVEIEKANKILRDAEEAEHKKNKSFMPTSVVAAPGMNEKAAIEKIFNKFDSDGSKSIDRQELKVLLSVLKVELTEEKLDKLLRELDADGTEEIEFEEFYTWFVREVHAKRSAWKQFTEGKLFNSSSSNMAFQQMVTEDAMKEFRIVHPPLQPCPDCDYCAVTTTELYRHKQDMEIHKEYRCRQDDLERKALLVDAAFVGAQGRRLLAHRLLYSIDLGGMEPRLRVASLEPYRPRIADPGGHREDQQRRGMMVQGEDPIAGVRAIPRQKGLHRQHRMPGALGSDNQLQDVLADLRHHEIDGIDTVNTEGGSRHVDIKFCWRHACYVGVEIIGEFNGWKPEELLGNPDTREYALVKSLPPGRYRYKYIVDGEHMVDKDASVVHDSDTVRNIIMVCNPQPTRPGGVQRTDKVLLQDFGLGDDGMWTLAASLKTNNVVQVLDLSHNSISDEGMMALGKALSQLLALHTLKLNGNGFGVDGCRYVVEGLCTSTTLLTLEMARNNLGDDSAEQLGRLLTYHHSINALYVDGCYLGNDGMDFIGQALERNRTLQTLSMSGNRIYPLGAGRLAFYLRRNSSLTDLRMDANPLGPDGAQHIGTMLGSNIALKSLSLSNTGMMRGFAHHGLHAITYSLRRNRTLLSVALRNNLITTENVDEIARSLTGNKTLTSMDLSGNTIDSRWFLPDTYIPTGPQTEMPSIRTSLDINIAAKDDPAQLPRVRSVVVQDRDMDDSFEGVWTARHKWKAIVSRMSIHMAEEAEIAKEKERMEDEQHVVEQELQLECVQVNALYASAEGCRMVVAMVKVLNEFCKKLGGTKGLSEELSSCRLAIVAMLMKRHDCDENYFVTIDKVPLIMHCLAVPCGVDDMNELLTETSVTKHGKVGIRRLLRFLIKNQEQLCGRYKMERLRMLSERLMGSSILQQEEVKMIYLDNVTYSKRKEAMNRYREAPFKEPRYFCSICNKRFLNMKEVGKHNAKPKEHRRARLKRTIWLSQRQLILRAKWIMTGTRFPAYYVLNPMIRFHKEISPQIFDTRGREGRPIGVVEPNITVRSEDILGDWMQLRYEDRMGWVQWREGSFNVLIPAMQNIRGFWDDLQTWSKPALYRISDDLPDYAEIKVRQMPLKDAVVCGNLRPGMVVQCWASLGPWIQLRYQHYASVWTLQRSGDRPLLVRLEEAVQKRLEAEFELSVSPLMVPLARVELAELASEIAEDDERSIES